MRQAILVRGSYYPLVMDTHYRVFPAAVPINKNNRQEPVHTQSKRAHCQRPMRINRWRTLSLTAQ